MKRPILVCPPAAAQAAFTLVEIMVALALSLLLLAAVIGMFGRVSEGISQSRSLLEMADRLRLTAQRLQMDLAGVTVTMNPPRDPANNEGYFEYVEGSTSISSLAQNTGVTPNVTDTTVGQVGDRLMFTTRSSGKPFVGKFDTTTAQSSVAEVAWFIRGHTLHRRVLLVLPAATLTGVHARRNFFYTYYDLSGRWDGTKVAPNSLADLTQRENRFAHNPTCPPAGPTPCDWGQLGLPTLAECSSTNWNVGGTPPLPSAKTNLDFWSNRTSSASTDSYAWPDTYFGTGSRLSDDIILTNVIGFDVKVWDPKAQVLQKVGGGATAIVNPGDPHYVDAANQIRGSFSQSYKDVENGVNYTYTLVGFGAYVDLGYNPPVAGGGFTYNTDFSSLGDNKSSLMPQDPNASSKARVYDTYSTSYFDPKGSNGIDDDNDGVVDNDSEKSPAGTALLPPYWYPLRGIQVKIRTFEPDSKQIREVTVKQDFLPQ